MPVLCCMTYAGMISVKYAMEKGVLQMSQLSIASVHNVHEQHTRLCWHAGSLMAEARDADVAYSAQSRSPPEAFSGDSPMRE